MIDIHCHLLYGVDDGAKTIDESLAMLKEAKAQGISDIILTPHYRHGMFSYPCDVIEANYEKIVGYANNCGIRLYGGCEYHVNSDIVKAFDSGRCLTLANSRYVLTEYSYASEFSYICRMTQELLRHGYIPVIAHAERYGCMVEDEYRAGELQDMGALIQCNADAVIGLMGRGPKKYCKKLLKNEMVDIVASDSHGLEKRSCKMEKCYEYIHKKFDRSYADRLTIYTPARILEG